MPLNKTSYFPGSQWNGTEIQYPDRSIFMAPDGYLNNRFIDEILAIENYLLQPVFQQITTIGPVNSLLGVTNDGINLEYKTLIAGAGVEITHDTGIITLSATGVVEETDPVFANSVANSITQNDVNDWDEAYGWGNHANAGYLTNETDPVFANSVANSITQNNVNDWDAAYGWGNHANAGYLTNETDPVFANSVANSITQNDVNDWDAAYGWGNHANAGYLTNETDPVFANSVANSITQNDVNDWDTAYGWGNHANAGYLTNETDPVFANSVANSITQNNVNDWDAAYSHKTTEDAVNGLVSCNGSGGYSAKTIGSDVQAYNAGLADISALAKTDSNVIVGNGTSWVAENGTTLRTSLGLGTGDSPQFAGVNTPALTNLTTNGLVKTTSGNGTLSVDANTYTPIITANTTYYVAATGNDTTGDGSSGNPWLTITKACSYIGGFVIQSGIIVTIQLNDGHYTKTTLIDILAHPNGSQISLTGQTTYSKTLSSIQSISGAAGAWTYILNLADVTNVEVGDGILIPRSVSGGTYPTFLAGCYIITNVDSGNNRITIVSNHAHASSASGAVTGTITIVKTVIYNETTNILRLSNKVSLNSLDKIVLYSNGVRVGLTLSQFCTLTALGTSFGICSCSTGMIVRNTSYNFGICFVSGCGYGVYLDNPSTIRDANITTVVSGCTTGLYFSNLASGLWNNLFVSGCTTGIYADLNAVLTATPAIIEGCGTGCYAADSGFLKLVTATFRYNTVDTNPLVNIRGNNEGYISST